MADETVTQGSNASYEAQEARRLKCNELEHEALAYGDHDSSLRHQLAQILCAGRYVVQGEGGDVTAERALLRFAAVTTKAFGIALAAPRGADAGHDTALYDDEAAIGLLGVAALLEAAPRLIDSFDAAGLDLRSDGNTKAVAVEPGGAT
jgi:hypothetical protein